MLSKEKIEKAKDFMIFYKNYCLNKETVNTEHYETVNNEEFVYKNIETILEYIDHLESREQKLIEKLEEEKFTIESTYSQINGNYFMAQDRLDLIKQILSILKGENDEH